LTQENPEFNSFAISLRFGYFFHRLTGLIADAVVIVKTEKVFGYLSNYMINACHNLRSWNRLPCL